MYIYVQEFVVGEIKGVHIREVYIFISGVSILERCPHFRGVHIREVSSFHGCPWREGFHCNYSLIERSGEDSLHLGVFVYCFPVTVLGLLTPDRSWLCYISDLLLCV